MPPWKVCEQWGDTPYSSCSNDSDGEPDWSVAEDIKVEFVKGDISHE